MEIHFQDKYNKDVLVSKDEGIEIFFKDYYNQRIRVCNTSPTGLLKIEIETYKNINALPAQGELNPHYKVAWELYFNKEQLEKLINALQALEGTIK